MLLKGKTALITGSNRGIGKAILIEFAKNGANVFAHARKESANFIQMIEDVASQYHVKIYPVYFDVTDTAGIKSAIMYIKKEQRRLDILVNNAGVMPLEAPIGMISKKIVQDVFDVNVFANIELIQYAIKLMMRQKEGSIVNLSSIAGVEGASGQVAYAASKGAIIAMTKSLAKELAPYSIRVNALAPGYINTDMFMSVPETSRETLLQNVGLGHLGTPEETAKACLFFASDLSAYVTGQILRVDGGIA